MRRLRDQLLREIADEPHLYTGLSRARKYAKAMKVDNVIDQLFMEWSPTVYDDRLDSNMLQVKKVKQQLALFQYGSNEMVDISNQLESVARDVAAAAEDFASSSTVKLSVLASCLYRTKGYILPGEEVHMAS